MTTPQTPAERAAVLAALQAEQNAALLDSYTAAKSALAQESVTAALAALTAAIAALPDEDPVKRQVSGLTQTAAIVDRTLDRAIARVTPPSSPTDA